MNVFLVFQSWFPFLPSLPLNPRVEESYLFSSVTPQSDPRKLPGARLESHWALPRHWGLAVSRWLPAKVDTSGHHSVLLRLAFGLAFQHRSFPKCFMTINTSKLFSAGEVVWLRTNWSINKSHLLIPQFIWLFRLSWSEHGANNNKVTAVIPVQAFTSGLHSMILVGPLQLGIFCYSPLYTNNSVMKHYIWIVSFHTWLPPYINVILCI